MKCATLLALATLAPAGGASHATGGPPARQEFELEGRLEGSFVIETDTERDMGGSSFSMHSVQEGTYRQTVRVTVEES